MAHDERDIHIPDDDSNPEVNFLGQVENFLTGVVELDDPKFIAFSDYTALYAQQASLAFARSDDPKLFDEFNVPEDPHKVEVAANARQDNIAQINATIGGIKLQIINHKNIPGYDEALRELSPLFWGKVGDQAAATEELRILMDPSRFTEWAPAQAKIRIAGKLNRMRQKIVDDAGSRVRRSTTP